MSVRQRLSIFIQLWFQKLIGANSRLARAVRVLVALLVFLSVIGPAYVLELFLASPDRAFLDTTVSLSTLVLGCLIFASALIFVGAAWSESRWLVEKIIVEFTPNECGLCQRAETEAGIGRSLWLGVRFRGSRTVQGVAATLIRVSPQQQAVGAQQLLLPAALLGIAQLHSSGPLHVEHIRLLTKDDATNAVITIHTIAAAPTSLIDHGPFHGVIQVRADSLRHPTEVEFEVVEDAEIPGLPTLKIVRQRQV